MAIGHLPRSYLAGARVRARNHFDRARARSPLGRAVGPVRSSRDPLPERAFSSDPADRSCPCAWIQPTPASAGAAGFAEDELREGGARVHGPAQEREKLARKGYWLSNPSAGTG